MVVNQTSTTWMTALAEIDLQEADYNEAVQFLRSAKQVSGHILHLNTRLYRPDNNSFCL